MCNETLPDVIMPVPSVSLHGTTKSTLMEDYATVTDHLQATLLTLALVIPHPRDYPNPLIYTRALRLHHQHEATLRQLLARYDDVRRCISFQPTLERS